jgi:hypothetical protein
MIDVTKVSLHETHILATSPQRMVTKSLPIHTLVGPFLAQYKDSVLYKLKYQYYAI